LSSGSELDPLQSAALLIYSGETFAYADLRVDKSPNPIADLDLLWRDWEPKADAYVIRTLDPDSAIPSREVEKQA
jgi:uncharacterized Ntn-hydrolase superfamily protein